MVKQLGAQMWNSARPATASPVFRPPLGDQDEGAVAALSSAAAVVPVPALTPVRELVFRLKLRLARA